MTYPQGLPAVANPPTVHSQLPFVRMSTFDSAYFQLFHPFGWIVNANSSSHSSCRCALSRVPFKRHTAVSPKKLPATASVAGSGERVVKEKKVTTRVAL